MTSNTNTSHDLDGACEFILRAAGRNLIVGLPLGIGKPNPLVNALYRRACNDSSIKLHLFTALSLEIPTTHSDLERRFLEPFAERHFGADYPSLDYVRDLHRHTVPDNVTVSEFYLQSGAWLNSDEMQQNYVCSNYTHVARDMQNMGVNVVLQMVAAEGDGATRRYSLSSNPDVTLDLIKRMAQSTGQRPCVVAMVNEQMPFMVGDAEVDADYFDCIVDDRALDFHPFAPPIAAVSATEYAIGMHASSLIRDGGTLQVGIGALGDALVRALELRHTHNSAYRSALQQMAVDEPALQQQLRIGGNAPFEKGLYAASEMFMDGFMHLHTAGILKRRAYESLDVQLAASEGMSESELKARFGDDKARGALLHAAFFLGSKRFYAWLRAMSDEVRRDFQMTAVSQVNELYGLNQRLESLQRRDARFVNTTMKMTLLGAAASDALENQRLVSGVGGQYNFVAMAHALQDGRSILLLRSGRGSGRKRQANVIWTYAQTTIPRHLRDIVITEYGVADLRGKSDQDVIKAMLAIADSRDQTQLIEQAKSAGKLDKAYALPEHASHNTPERIQTVLSQAEFTPLFPEFPYGSDFTNDELDLIDALKQLQRDAASATGWFRLARKAMHCDPNASELQSKLVRMQLGNPRTLRDKLLRRLLAACITGN